MSLCKCLHGCVCKKILDDLDFQRSRAYGLAAVLAHAGAEFSKCIRVLSEELSQARLELIRLKGGVQADVSDDGMCSCCVSPWKCNGCEKHMRHNCSECHLEV